LKDNGFGYGFSWHRASVTITRAGCKEKQEKLIPTGALQKSSKERFSGFF
jgi:hypothetical protein